MLKIGKAELKHGIMLAPMAGATDYAFRKVCRSFGAEYLVSEMVCAKALCYEQKIKKSLTASPSKTAPLAAIRENELPMAVQIFGSEPEFMAEAAKMIAENSYRGSTSLYTPSAIDINMGCPVQKVVSNGEGSALLKNPELAGKIVEAVVGAVDIPVTVKIRIGWDKNSINAVEVAKILEDSGADLICVHGRTREQFYAPSSDNRIIAEVKKAVSIPVIGNGDIYSVSDAIRMFDETECDGIMLARGILGNPWLFSEIASALEKTPYIPPNTEEKIYAALNHTKSVIEEKGERGVSEAKGQLAWYVKGIRGASSARDRIHSASSFEEMEKILLELAKEACLEDSK